MYSIGVRIEGIESRRRNSVLLHLIIGLFLIIKASDYYRYENYQNFIAIIPFLVIGSFSLFYGFFRRKIDLTYQYNYWLRLLQVTCFFLLGILMVNVGTSLDYLGLFIFAFLSIILLFSERRIFQETNLLIDEKGILIPGYYRDHLVKWEDLENVVVREDFVTLFHIRQKFLQFQVLQDLSTLEVAKMNAFCRERIGLRQSEQDNVEQKRTS